MVTKQELEQQLATADFYKKVYPGMFKSENGKKPWKHGTMPYRRESPTVYC